SQVGHFANWHFRVQWLLAIHRGCNVVKAGRCIGLTCHIQPAALVEPSLVLIALWETERNGTGESKRRNLAGLVAVESLHQLERATPHGVKGLCSGHDLPGSEQVDLEPATGKLGDAGHKAFFKLLRCRAA